MVNPTPISNIREMTKVAQVEQQRSAKVHLVAMLNARIADTAKSVNLAPYNTRIHFETQAADALMTEVAAEFRAEGYFVSVDKISEIVPVFNITIDWADK